MIIRRWFAALLFVGCALGVTYITIGLLFFGGIHEPNKGILVAELVMSSGILLFAIWNLVQVIQVILKQEKRK